MLILHEKVNKIPTGKNTVKYRVLVKVTQGPAVLFTLTFF
jgi:hypothetical protein